MNIVLASASPRRKELLERIVQNFKIIPSGFDENNVSYLGDIEQYVCNLSEEKAKFILDKVQYPSIVIGCDTIVFYNGKILGKPKSHEEAIEMLKMLSGNTHEVYSGITLINTKTNRILSKSFCTKVTFMDLSDEMIHEYVSSNEPMDKAGAYGIQGKGAVFVKSIVGCYYNVMGLSLNGLYLLFREMGVNL